ncbi:uncharacterized protein LOC132758969 isoform X1 [Ruditapes philippinarum]|uniref:uncharacterized protein LOC132758969 isoform X1 n=1 Tax=Ruditapes philippinarum TaxID=129788 RepID=UPI00295AD49F|nr:uncharacterized protein LOC132758969 isoform X1 [Ruditapes philippinarum]
MCKCMEILFLTAVVVSAANAMTTLYAVYNMGGVTGKVTFNQSAPGQSVTIYLDLSGLSSNNYDLELHEYRVNFDTKDVCSEENIGAVIGTAKATSGTGQLVASGMDLSGIKSIEGRSFAIKSDSLLTCATIEADADYITAFAYLPAEIGGTVIFRQQDNSESADTFMYLDLYSVGETLPQDPLKWQINGGIVKMDIDASTDINNRCGSTIKTLYNPDGADGSGCSTENHSNCRIGDLSAKHGDITFQTSGKTKAFFGDLKLPLSGKNSIIGKTLVFMNGSEYYACANIVQYPRMGAISKFSNDNVTGMITFNQKSPLDPVTISVNLDNLDIRAGGYHVHEWPVPQKILKEEAVCSNAHVGGHFNPFKVGTGGVYPSPALTTPDKYEVGDISGKFGLMTSMNSYVKNMTDPNMQLFGKNTIIGRSVVIHKSLDGSRWICASIWPSDDIPMTTAYARFTYPVIGYIVLRQPKDMWYAETQIYAELDYAAASTSPTVNHNWHVHETSMGDDMLSQTGRCQSVGPHYNPYSVYLSGDYTTMCNSYNQFRCELGDLSGKHGKLNIRSNLGGKLRYFFSDMQLPLSGPQTIVGKSIVIHDANAGGGRLACGNVMLKVRREVAVTKWSSAEGQSSPTGSISFAQECVDILSGVTKVSVSLSNLNDMVGGYHIHEYPTSVDTPSSDVCQSSDVGGHMNPFDSPYPGPAKGTQDEYEIGDLSGKYDPLTGASYSTTVHDMTIAMEGPLSIVGRSIVIHKTDAGATRWACGTIEDTTPDTKVVRHKAMFEGEITGYIMLTQYYYKNKDTSNTQIVVNLHYTNDKMKMTTGHNWHVHENRKSTDCASCGPHYNPYMVNMNSGYSECGMDNPLRCEMGDQSSKVGKYDIGGGKRFYTDVNLNIEGKYSAAKRSIVIHGPNGAGERIACANLIPYGTTAAKGELQFPKKSFIAGDIEAKVAMFVGTSVDNVLVEKQSDTVACTKVNVYFLGENKDTLKNQYEDNLRSTNYNNLGDYAPEDPCAIVSSSDVISMSIISMVICLLLSKLRIWS